MSFNACTCNIAHSFIYAFEDSIYHWYKKPRKQKIKNITKVKETLRFFELNGESPFFKRLIEQRAEYLPLCNEESTGCLKFLLRAWYSMSAAPDVYIKQFDNYYPALASISLDILNKAAENKKALPNDFSFKHLLIIFSDSTDWNVKYNILSGIRKLVSNTSDYHRWRIHQHAIGQGNLFQIFCYYKLNMKTINNQTLKAKSALELIYLWTNLVEIFLNSSEDEEIQYTENEESELVGQGIIILNLIKDILPLKGDLLNLFTVIINPFKDKLLELKKAENNSFASKLLVTMAEEANKLMKAGARNETLHFFLTDISYIMSAPDYFKTITTEKDSCLPKPSNPTEDNKDKNMEPKGIDIKIEGSTRDIMINFGGKQKHNNVKDMGKEYLVDVIACYVYNFFTQMINNHHDFSKFKKFSESIENRSDVSQEELTKKTTEYFVRHPLDNNLPHQKINDIIQQLTISASGSMLAQVLVSAINSLEGLSVPWIQF